MSPHLVSLLVCVLVCVLSSAPGASATAPSATAPSATAPSPAGLEGVDGDDGAARVIVRGGVFTLGDLGGRYDEQPLVTVRLSSFDLDRTEVDNGSFAAFVAARGYQPIGPWRRGFPEGGERLPVRFVSWYDARAYCLYAGADLPTEAQWEAAAQTHPDRVSTLGGDANQPPAMIDRARRGDDVLLLGGSLREWTADWYDRYRYALLAAEVRRRRKPLLDPSGPVDGTQPEARFVDAGAAAGNERSTRKAVRGASWVTRDADALRPARRDALNPRRYYDDVGFRCAARRTDGNRADEHGADGHGADGNRGNR